MKLVSLLFSLLALLIPTVLWGAARPIPNPPELNATSYFLVDFDSGRVLAEKNPDDPVEPASITKLMTAYLVDKAIADGDVTWVTKKCTNILAYIEKKTQMPIQGHKFSGQTTWCIPSCIMSTKNYSWMLVVLESSVNQASLAANAWFDRRFKNH